MIKKTLTILAGMAMLAFPVVLAHASSPAMGGGDTNGATSNGSSSGGPSMGGGDTNGATSNGDKTTPPAMGGGDTNGATSGSGTNGGGNTGGSSGGAGSSGGGSYTVVGSAGGIPLLASTVATSTRAFVSTICPFITTPLKQGGDNSPAEVTKLQTFLKASEHADVDANGVFDQKTEAAVEAFQRKYLPTIMGPWDATRPSGFVYITTMKLINEMVCNTSLTLSDDQLAVIAAWKAKMADGAQADMTAGITGSGTTGTSVGGNSNLPAFNSRSNASNTSQDSGDVGTVDGMDNSADVGNASILSRFWAFIVNLFR